MHGVFVYSISLYVRLLHHVNGTHPFPSFHTVLSPPIPLSISALQEWKNEAEKLKKDLEAAKDALSAAEKGGDEEKEALRNEVATLKVGVYSL